MHHPLAARSSAHSNATLGYGLESSPFMVKEDDDCAKFNREDFIYLAKMSEQCERFDEMLGFVRKFISMSDTVLTPDEKHVFAAAFKNAVGNRRAELRVLTVIEQKEQRKTNIVDEQLVMVERYKKDIETELNTLCTELIRLVDDKLLPLSKTPLNEIYYKKMKGDYFRYLAEFMPEDDKGNIIENCEKSYLEADKLAKVNLPPTHPLRLGLQLNMSVFEYEVLQQPGRAVHLASTALDEAFANIDKIKEENFKESTLIMQLLRDNLTLWTAENTAES